MVKAKKSQFQDLVCTLAIRIWWSTQRGRGGIMDAAGEAGNSAGGWFQGWLSHLPGSPKMFVLHSIFLSS
jgi:hypothetical protein